MLMKNSFHFYWETKQFNKVNTILLLVRGKSRGDGKILQRFFGIFIVVSRQNRTLVGWIKRIGDVW
jgi:hypothetical protein